MEMFMLPRQSRNRDIKVMIHGFETALEDALPNPRDINRIYLIEKEHLANRLDLVDAIEQTCKIIMVDPTLLRAFTDIPRMGYSFYLYFDKYYDLWLHVTIQGKGPVKRCLGGGVRPDSNDCLFSLPQYADVVATILMKMDEEKTIPLDQTDSVVLPSLETRADESSNSPVVPEKRPIGKPEEDSDMDEIDEVDASL